MWSSRPSSRPCIPGACRACPRIPRAGCTGSLATRSWMHAPARHAAAHRPGLGTFAAARHRAAIRRSFPRLGDRGQPAPDDLRLLPPGPGSREPDRPHTQVALRLQQRRDRARTARVRGDRQEANPAPPATTDRAGRGPVGSRGRRAGRPARLGPPVSLSALQRRLRSLQRRRRDSP